MATQYEELEAIIRGIANVYRGLTNKAAIKANSKKLDRIIAAINTCDLYSDRSRTMNALRNDLDTAVASCSDPQGHGFANRVDIWEGGLKIAEKIEEEAKLIQAEEKAAAEAAAVAAAGSI